MIVVPVFLLIMNPMDFCLARNYNRKTATYDRIPFDLKAIGRKMFK